MATQAFELNATVRVNTKAGTFEGVISSYARGWYTVTMPDGTTCKAREADLHQADQSRNMAATLARYRPSYRKLKSYRGKLTQDNGDDLAVMLAHLSPQQVMRVAEISLGMEPEFLLAKYERLNLGQQRMNSGNRIRAAIKRQDITLDDVKSALKAVVA